MAQSLVGHRTNWGGIGYARAAVMFLVIIAAGPAVSSEYHASKTVDIDEAVGDDLVAAGERVTVRAPVAGDVTLGGREVVIEAAIAGDARIAAESLTLRGEGAIAGDAWIWGREIAVLGAVSGDADIAAERVVIDDEIGGDVAVTANRLTLGPNARIGGSLDYSGASRPDISPEARIGGAIKGRYGDHRTWSFDRRGDFGLGHMSRGWGAGSVVALVLLGIGFGLAAPGFLADAALAARQALFSVFLTGVVALVVTPIVAILFAITIIGLPVALIIIAVYGFGWVAGLLTTAHLMGDWALRALGRGGAPPSVRVLAQGLAILVLALVSAIPLVGGLFVFLALAIGVGALIAALQGRRGPAREDLTPGPA